MSGKVVMTASGKRGLTSSGKATVDPSCCCGGGGGGSGPPGSGAGGCPACAGTCYVEITGLIGTFSCGTGSCASLPASALNMGAYQPVYYNVAELCIWQAFMPGGPLSPCSTGITLSIYIVAGHWVCELDVIQAVTGFVCASFVYDGGTDVCPTIGIYTPNLTLSTGPVAGSTASIWHP